MRRLTVVPVLATGLVPMPATAQTTYTCFGEVADTIGTPKATTCTVMSSWGWEATTSYLVGSCVRARGTTAV